MPNRESGLMTIEEIRRLMTIDDATDLAVANRQQKRILLSAGELEAEAENEYLLRERRQKVKWSELELEIRRDPSSFDLKEKPNEGEIKAAIECNEKYQKAVERTLEAKHVYELLKALVQAVKDRRREIETEVELIAFDYHAEPKPRTPNGSAVREKIEAGSARSAVMPPKRRRNDD